MATVILPEGEGGEGEGGGPDPSWEHIAAQVLTVAADNIEFTGIGSAFHALRVTLYGIVDVADGNVNMRINGDSGSNYDQQYVNHGGTHAATTAGRNAGVAQWQVNPFDLMELGSSFLFVVTFVKPIVTVPCRILSTLVYERTGGAEPYMGENGGRWNNVADAIASINFYTAVMDFDIGSYAVLEGIQLIA